MLDFADTGQIGLFVDEAGRRGARGGDRQGRHPARARLAPVFSALRANDLIWPYVVNNYLKGGRRAAFDLLYWNADSTNLPGPMYCWYVRNTYLENKLREPGALCNCGVPVDLGKVDVPTFILATREDHIVPWRAPTAPLGCSAARRRFVLGASGHIAGVVNPPAKNKRSYWVGERDAPRRAETLARTGRRRPGSWWPEWSDWLARHSRAASAQAPQRAGSAQYPAIEPAPGRYVKRRRD